MPILKKKKINKIISFYILNYYFWIKHVLNVNNWNLFLNFLDLMIEKPKIYLCNKPIKIMHQ